MIIIHQISQTMDHYMPLLGDYRSYRDLTYTLLPQISMVKTNTTKSLLCSSLLNEWWTIATILIIIIPQISPIMDHYMPLLGDYRCYRDLTYALLSQISMEKTNTTKPLLCSSCSHWLVDNCNYFDDHYSPDISKNWIITCQYSMSIEVKEI